MQVEHFTPRLEHIRLRDARDLRFNGVQRVAGAFTREPQDLGLGIRLRIADAHVHQESIKLRFRQRERAFLFDRVLRRHHQE